MFIIQMNFESFGQVLRIDSSLQVSFLNQKSGVFQVSRVVVKFCEQHRVGSFFSGLYFNQLYAIYAAAAAAKSPQSCPTLCDPIDGSPPGSPVHGILQARTLEWGAMSFSNAWKWKVKVKSLSRVRLFATPWTAAHQAPPSMGFSRQEYWSEFNGINPAKLSGWTRQC